MSGHRGFVVLGLASALYATPGGCADAGRLDGAARPVQVVDGVMDGRLGPFSVSLANGVD